MYPVYKGHLGNQKRSLDYQTGVRFLIQRITENRLRQARGPVQNQTIRYIYDAVKYNASKQNQERGNAYQK